MASTQTKFQRADHANGARFVVLVGAALIGLGVASSGLSAQGRRDDSYHPPADASALTPPPGYADPGAPPGYGAPAQGGYGQNTYGQPPPAYSQSQTYGQAPGYGQPPASYGQPPYNRSPTYAAQSNGTNGGYVPYSPGQGANEPYRPQSPDGANAPGGYGTPYSAEPPSDPPRYEPQDGPTRGYYSQGEIAEAGRGFFGSITKGLASAIEYTYSNLGRPNGYVLGEDGGGAFFAGLRYGEGTLFTKDAGDHKVFWQGPSLGYDVGGEGSKIMILAYNMRDPGDMYHRFGGVEGSTYLVGGVSVQLQKFGDVTLAVIRSGIGLRLGVNVGYLKYTRSPTWNPF